VHQILPFYQHPNFLLSPSLSLVGLPCYPEKVALAFADESSDSSLHFSPSPRHYDGRVFSYLDQNASATEDS
jgi:hypothetical protein